MNNLLKISLITLSLLSTSSNAWWWDKKDIVELPPHPGGAGKATLGGIDSDNDGVRDDIQIAIYKRYDSDAQKRATLSQLSKSLQSALLVDISVSSDKTAVTNSIDVAISCLFDTFGDDNTVGELPFVKRIVTNTTERYDAYSVFNASLGGFYVLGNTSYECEGVSTTITRSGR